MLEVGWWGAAFPGDACLSSTGCSRKGRKAFGFFCKPTCTVAGTLLNILSFKIANIVHNHINTKRLASASQASRNELLGAGQPLPPGKVAWLQAERKILLPLPRQHLSCTQKRFKSEDHRADALNQCEVSWLLSLLTGFSIKNTSKKPRQN